MTDYGMVIRLRRVELGWTQAQLADAAGMHQANVSKIESGRVLPAADTVERLMAAMGNGEPVFVRRREERFRPLPTAGLHEVDLAAMMGSEPTAVDWLVGSMIARGAVTMLAGKEGQGKSLLAQSIAVGMAMDKRNVAGLDSRPGRAWIIDAENGPQLLHRRLVGLGLGAFGATKLRLWDADGFDLSRDHHIIVSELERAEHRPDVIVLDSFKTLWHGSESNPQAVTDVLNSIREIARTFDLGIVLIHHTTKLGDTYRGSSAIGATLEAVFTFTRPRGVDFEDTNYRILQCRKMRLGAEPITHWIELRDGKIHKAEPQLVG